MQAEQVEVDEEVYVDVRSLPLKPPQPLVLPERPVRRCWHPVMWDDSITGVVTPVETQEDEDEVGFMTLLLNFEPERSTRQGETHQGKASMALRLGGSYRCKSGGYSITRTAESILMKFVTDR